MRHAASAVAGMEGISRQAFLIGRELASNSRSGLTVRFLSKKLDLPEEEVEYLVDVNHRFLFTDLTKIKLVPEGFSAIKRIFEGLANRGDVPALFRLVKSLSAHDFRRLEEQIGLRKPGTKKYAVKELLARYNVHPDSVVTYVATRGFSEQARELFDIVWQSKDGLMPMAKLRVAFGGTDYESELALWELFRGLALFEMFRFDADERLVRVAGLLSEIRQYREAATHLKARTPRLKSRRRVPELVDDPELRLSDTICRLVAALAAKPARLRGDGDLFREDRRRLEEIAPEEAEPSLSTCLWAAEGVGWLARVDNELRAGELEALLKLDRLSRHRILYDWLVRAEGETTSLESAVGALVDLRTRTWYPTLEFVKHAARVNAEHEAPTLRCMGGCWEYVGPSAAGHWERTLARALEETFFWLGAVARGQDNDESVFAVTKLGECLMAGKDIDKVAAQYPKRDAEIIVQPNFDIVVPMQDMDPLLTVPLDQFAVRASTGQATVYNVTKDSFTQAVQEGHDGDAFVDFLVAHNRGGTLPANVMTTLDDWRGGMKRVRLRTVHVIESDDPLVLADVLHRRRFKKYLKPIDPHKMARYTKVSKSDLSKILEKDGFVVD